MNINRGNSRIKVFIAERDNETINKIKNQILLNEDMTFVGSSETGKEALNIIKEQNPDVAIINVMLSYNDGIWVLEEIKRLNITNVNCIMISEIGNIEIVKKSLELGAKYFIIKPFDTDVILNRIRQLYELSASSKISREIKTINENINSVYPQTVLEQKITLILNELGVPASIKGYKFLKTAVDMYIKEPDCIVGITKLMYPKIAKLYRTDEKKVERAIRHAIETSWNKGERDKFTNILGIPCEKKPTNRQFIALIAESIKINYPYLNL